ncbi:MAG: CCA tRNA nucleotidyltransferase [Candidatus Omnitrophica bacterium]|nr:CCA tRNA nucleotidyltransferase [Candidatus Omnitrophota bacterium]
MKSYLEKLPPELKKIIDLAAEVSQETAMPAYLVGGFLRDLILGVANFDIDITVEGSGIIFAQKLAKKLKSGIRIHERFGTATLTLDNCLKVDIATTRKEKYPSCACLPVVSSGSLKEDLMRRDFTINAMAVSIAQDNEQKLIDPFGGKEDLKSGRIRILHDLSFKDDPTRILRAIRFEQRFDFKIEPKTLALLKEAIGAGLLSKAHAHRTRDDLILMLKERDPLKQIKRLGDLGGLSFLSDKLKFGKSTQDLFKAIDKEICWFMKNYSARRQLDTWLVYFTALLKPLSLAQLKLVTCKLGLRKGEEKRIISYCRDTHKLVPSLSKKGIRPAHIFSLLEPLSYEEIVLLRAAGCQNKYLKEYITDFLEIYNGMRLYVSGRDLHGLGILPGPRYQKIFAQVLAAKLNGQVKTRRQELALIKRLIKIY